MTAKNAIRQTIGQTFIDIANAIETGRFGEKVKVGITILGSEHGVDNLVKGAEFADRSGDNFDIVLIGPRVDTKLELVEVQSEEEAHKKMEELLDSGYIKSCVTMHYNFPIGVSTVGKVVTPAMGREMFISTTTGTSSVHRVEAMVRNALHGIISAKAMGIEEPSLGILNVDGARQVERALHKLNDNGYKVKFADSVRADGGAVMRGNDLLAGSVDVMVTDTLTGNIMMKMFSSFTTGGGYEATGYGYGPGIGEAYKRIILIVSRASGVPVVANAIKYAARLAQGKLMNVAKDEYAKAKAAGLDEIFKSLIKDITNSKENDGEIVAPAKEVVTGSIAGVDIMELEDAVKALWKEGIYAESGMGCTGPIVMVSEEKVEQATAVLATKGFVAKPTTAC